MSIFMPIYANEDPNKDLNYSDCLKHLQIPQNIGSPFMFLGITHYLLDFLSQSRVKFLKWCQTHFCLEVASKTTLVWLLMLVVTAR